jgi:hypothetical protein
MMQTAVTKAIKTLNELEARFGLQRAESDRFFPEWAEELPPLADSEKAALDRIKTRYLYHSQMGAVAEGAVNLIVVSPLLELAGFYDPPRIRSEVTVELTTEVEGETLQGRIDTLVISNQLWVAVVESKHSQLNPEAAIPQTLAYLMACPDDRPGFGMVTSGDLFCFLKLAKQPPRYDISRTFSTLPRPNELYAVLQILKRIGLNMS